MRGTLRYEKATEISEVSQVLWHFGMIFGWKGYASPPCNGMGIIFPLPPVSPDLVGRTVDLGCPNSKTAPVGSSGHPHKTCIGNHVILSIWGPSHTRHLISVTQANHKLGVRVCGGEFFHARTHFSFLKPQQHLIMKPTNGSLASPSSSSSRLFLACNRHAISKSIDRGTAWLLKRSRAPDAPVDPALGGSTRTHEPVRSTWCVS